MWLVVFALVSLAHLALFLALERLLSHGLWPQEKPSSLAVQLVSAPPPLPVPPRPSPQQPATQAPVQLGAAEPSPSQAVSGQQSLSPAQASAKDLPIAQSFESSLDPNEGSAQASDLLRSGGVAMTAYWGDFASGSPIGQSTIELSFPEPDRYEVKMVTQAKGWARLFASTPMLAQAKGRLGPNGFVPEHYAHQGPRRSEVTVFDYEKEEIRYESLKEPLPLLKGIQDRLTFMLQLAWMLQTDPDRFTIGQTVSLPLAGRDKVEEVDFLVLSDADLALPGGLVVPALHLSSNRQTSRYSVQIDIWMDRTDRLLPVRIRFEEARGTVLDLLTVRN